jgi:hypothetical protein
MERKTSVLNIINHKGFMTIIWFVRVTVEHLFRIMFSFCGKDIAFVGCGIKSTSTLAGYWNQNGSRVKFEKLMRRVSKTHSVNHHKQTKHITQKLNCNKCVVCKSAETSVEYLRFRWIKTVRCQCVSWKQTVQWKQPFSILSSDVGGLNIFSVVFAILQEKIPR